LTNLDQAGITDKLTAKHINSLTRNLFRTLGHSNLSTDLDSEKESELFQKINDGFAKRIGGYSLILKPGEFAKTGSFNTTAAGYRYVIMVGFRF
jgi:ribosomal protein L17